jgi:recombination protein RecT
MSESTLAVYKRPSELLGFLEKGKSAIEQCLPKHLNSERMIRLALTCFSKDKNLRECSGQSIYASLLVASLIGLEPGVAGQAYLIPYKGTCTFVPGWQGLVGLLNNSGKATAWTGAVFEGDEWDFQLGSEPKCHHRPGENFGDIDKLIWVYACGQVHGSERPIIEAWPIRRVWLHRDRFNKVGARHYSFNHPEMYARKVVLLQILKYMPKSIELTNAMTAANAADVGMTAKVHEGLVIETPAERTGDTGAPDGEMLAEEASWTA